MRLHHIKNVLRSTKSVSDFHTVSYRDRDRPGDLPHICKNTQENRRGFLRTILGNNIFADFEIDCNRSSKSSLSFSLLQHSEFHNTDAK